MKKQFYINSESFVVLFSAIFIFLSANSFSQISNGCINADFELNNFTNWVGYTGSCCPVVMTNTGLNTVGAPGDDQPQHFITSGSGTDPNTPNPSAGGAQIPFVSPFGGLYSCRLGNSSINYHAERLVYTIHVTNNNDLFYYRYAVVLQDPGHPPGEQPRFEIEILDSSGSYVPNGHYLIVSGASIPGFYTSSANSIYRCKDWTTGGVVLSNYIGQTVTLQFTTTDCGYGGHFGYAYVEAGCAPMEISENFCPGNNNGTMTAPFGFKYSWTGPGITTPDTNQTITIPNSYSGSTFTCICTCSLICDTDTLTKVFSPIQVSPNFFYSVNCGTFTFTNTTPTSLTTFSGWLWNFGDGPTDTSKNPIHTFYSPGIYNITISGTTQSGCIVTNTIPVTVSTVPTISVNSNSPLCSGDSLKLFTNPGFTYLWLGQNNFYSTIQNPLIPNTNSSYSGQYDVIVTDTNNCQAIGSVYVTVYPLPIPTIGSNSPVCPGDTIKLTASGGIGYLWHGPFLFSSTIQNPVIPDVTSWNAGTYIITVTDTTGCSASTSTNVTIVPIPPDIVPVSNSPICAGDTLQLNISGGVSYYWSGPNSFTSTLSNPEIDSATALNSGTYYITVTTGGNSCNFTFNTLVNIVSISSNISYVPFPACTGSLFQFLCNPLGGVPYSFQWTGPDGFSSTQQNPLITNTTLYNSGTYSVTVTGFNNCTDTSSAQIIFHTSPTITMSGNSPVCFGDSIKLNAVPGGNYTFLWTGPDGFSSTLQNPAFPVSSVSMGGAYYLTATDSNGCTVSDSIIIYLQTGSIQGLLYSQGSVVTSSDSITIFLYRKSNSIFLFYDSTLYSGGFTFNDVIPGYYIVRALINNSQYPYSVPSYYDSTYSWQQADNIAVTCNSNFNINLKMVGITSLASGNGHISGNIWLVNNNTKSLMSPVKNAHVSIEKLPANVIVNDKESDTSGFYNFQNIQVGNNYRINVDIPCFPLMSTYNIDISGSDTLFEHRDFILDTNLNNRGIYRSDEFGIGYLKLKDFSLQIYPNPYNDFVNINYILSKVSDVHIEVYDLLGNKIESIVNETQKTGNYSYKFNNVSNNSEISFIKITANGTVYIKKIVKIK